MNAGSGNDDSLVKTTMTDLAGQVEEERRQMAEHVRYHPCPDEDQVHAWVHDACGEDTLDSTSQPLKLVLAGYSLKGVLALDHQACKEIYEAPLTVKEEDEKKILVRAGQRLAEHGGLTASQSHYAFVNCALNSGYFYPGAERPLPVKLYMRSVELDWDDAGFWCA